MSLDAANRAVLARNEGAPDRLSDAYHTDGDYGLSFVLKQLDLLRFTGVGGGQDASIQLGAVLTAAVRHDARRDSGGPPAAGPAHGWPRSSTRS